MNIDKTREEFETWYTQKANKDTGMVMSMEDIASMRGTKMDYGAYGYMHGCWIGWQASRAAIEVELQKDAARYRWLCDGNGYYLEEAGLCGHSNEKAEADEAIDFYMANGCPP